MARTVKHGDCVELGSHRLVCGDAFNPEHVDLLMQGEKAAMLYCDPPYGIRLDTDFSSMKPYGPLVGQKLQFCPGRGGIGTRYEQVVGDDVPFDPRPLIESFSQTREQFWWGADYYASRLPPGGSWVVWDKRGNENRDRIWGSCFELCWSRTRHKRDIARVTWAGLWGLQHEPERRRLTPTQKPIKLCEWFLERYSQPDAIVVDLFAGSGSTLLACERIGRVARLLEVDPSSCDLIIKRWHAFSAGEAARQLYLELPETRAPDVLKQQPEPLSLQLTFL